MPEDIGYTGITPEQIKGQSKKKDEVQSQDQQSPQNETGEVQSSDQQQPEAEKSETSEQGTLDDKDVNILKNTFGVDPSELPQSQQDKILKVAKSYREAQAKFTKEQEQRQLFESTLDNFQTRLQAHPEVWDTVEKVAKGEYSGNSKKEPEGQPTKKSQPAIANEQTLIDEGYLTANDLDGLDEIAKNRVVAKAEIDFYKDQQLEEIERQTRETFEKVSNDRKKQEREETVKQTNDRRFTDSFDKFVSQFGVDFTSLDDDAIGAIRKRANVIRDPQDPSLLDVDAFYDAAKKELAIRGKLPEGNPIQPSQNGVNQILDTGYSANKQSSPSKPKGTQQKMDEHIAQRWEDVNNRLSKTWKK